jgi:Protein of unknown function (DUF2933)
LRAFDDARPLYWSGRWENSMSLHDHSNDRNQPQGSFLTSRAGLVLLGFLVIGGALLFTEHRAHVLGALIWLPLLLCPLMHIFMHGGHGHGGHAGHDQRDRERSKP